jgi:hypothetical protein
VVGIARLTEDDRAAYAAGAEESEHVSHKLDFSCFRISFGGSRLCPQGSKGGHDPLSFQRGPRSFGCAPGGRVLPVIWWLLEMNWRGSDLDPGREPIEVSKPLSRLGDLDVRNRARHQLQNHETTPFR